MISKSKLKYIQSLSHKKFRDEEGVFIAEGPRIINEALGTNGIEVRELFATKDWPGIDASPAVTVVSDPELERISLLSTPNQVLGIFRKPSPRAPELKGAISLFIDGIQDPGNMGTIIRCADWFGIEHVVCSPDCADAFGPKTVQSTMGSIVRVNVVVSPLVEILLQHRDVSVYAATLDGGSLYDITPLTEGIILVGSEARGLSEELLSLAHHRITIPRRGKAESLNAAVATGIVLSHLLH